jgi:hypothetical protein
MRMILVVLVIMGASGHAMSISESPDMRCDAVWDSVFDVTTDSVSQYLAYGPQHSLAVDASGSLHVVWYEYRSPLRQIGYRKYDRAAGFWPPETTLTNMPRDCYSPAIACGASGDVHVAWYTSSGDSCGIWYKRFDALSAAWQPETLLCPAETSGSSSHPSLACRPGGDDVHLVWQAWSESTGSHVVRHIEFSPGTGWSADSALGEGHYPSVAVDGNDDVYVVWDSSEPYMCRRVAGSWLPAGRFSNASAYHVAVAVDTAGSAVHAVWYGETDDSDECEILYQRLTAAGWSSLAHVSREPDFAQYYPSVSCAPDGRCDVAWVGYDGSSGGAKRLYSAMRFDDGFWTRPQALTSTQDASRPCIAHDPDGGLHLVWYDHSTGNYDVHYLRGRHCQRDAAVLAFVSPSALGLPGQAVTPAVTVGSQGLVDTAAFRAYLRVDSSDVEVYRDSVDVAGLAPGETLNVSFREWTPGDSATYVLETWVTMAGDEDSGNDSLSQTLQTVSWSNGWSQAKHALWEVQRGGWMTGMAANGLAYMCGGQNRGFGAYDAVHNVWARKRSFPSGIAEKTPKKGSRGITDGGRYIYATKGNNTPEFWSYDVVTDSWHQLSGVPLGSTNTKVKGGADVEYVVLDDTGYVYLLKGYKNEFWRYNTARGTWQAMASAPVGASIRWNEGSWLAYDGARTLYAHKARFHELWSYDVLTDSWAPRQFRGMPFTNRMGKSKKSKDGSNAVWHRGAIYALKGGNTLEFWRYSVSGDTWSELDSMPRGRSRKKVKYGADLVGIGHDAFFGSKGGKSDEIWRYVLPDALKQAEPGFGAGAEAGRAISAARPSTGWPGLTIVHGTLHVSSSLAAGGLRPGLYDASGRRLAELHSGDNDVSGFAPGVYFVGQQSDGAFTSHRLVLTGTR